MKELAGKVAIVTGASRGIGAATARELAARGASVVLASRSLEACDRVAASIRGEGGSAEAAACDVGRWRDVEELVERTVAEHGRLDILVNNAGMIAPIGRLDDCDPESWGQNVAVNLMGAFHGCRAALPHFRRAGRGVIVSLSSGAAHRPLKGWSAYCAAKAGLAMLTRGVAREAAAAGVRVYGLQPGVVDTEMQAEIRATPRLDRTSGLRPHDLAPARDPARAIAWLCGERAAPLAGMELPIAVLKPAWLRLPLTLLCVPRLVARRARERR